MSIFWVFQIGFYGIVNVTLGSVDCYAHKYIALTLCPMI